MTVQRMDHVGVVVDDLDEAVGFFVELGLEVQGTGSVGDDRVDRIIGLDGVQTEIAMLQTPGGVRVLELIEFRSPPIVGDDDPAPSNARGLRHVTFAVDDIDGVLARLQARGAQLIGELVRYGDSYRLCYLRGPAGIIVELAEPIG